MLNQGSIRESESPYNSPLWIVPKKMDNSNIKKWRIVIDYKKLNEVTIDDKFPIPNIDSLLDRLGRAQYFTTLDLATGFHQILVREEDQNKQLFPPLSDITNMFGCLLGWKRTSNISKTYQFNFTTVHQQNLRSLFGWHFNFQFILKRICNQH